MALDHFAANNVDVAVVEVGLGGRLDATNVVHPVAAWVTQIGIDHTEFLGNTLREIAAEKAGIFKSGVPAIVGEVELSLRDHLAEMAVAAGASRVIAAGRDWVVSGIEMDSDGTSFSLSDERGTRRLRTPLVGEFQAHNTATALATLRSAGGLWAQAEENAAEHLADIRLPGRFHRHGRYLFDVAHNSDGARALCTNIRRLEVARPIVALVTVLRDKDWRGILRAVDEVADSIIVSIAPTAPQSRSWDLDEVADFATGEGIAILIEPDFAAALARASESGATVLVTGSFHTVGDAMERLQVDPLAR